MDNLKKFMKMPNEEALKQIIYQESESDRLLEKGKMTQWRAWENYFALMYECNVRMSNIENNNELEKRFEKIRVRLLSKINTEKFNPFKTTDPTIFLIARACAAEHGLNTNFDN